MSADHLLNFMVPAGLSRGQEILDLAQRTEADHPGQVRIQAYDTVQGLQWNGGRLVYNDLMRDVVDAKSYPTTSFTADDLPRAVEQVKKLNDQGISFNLTFNNVLESLDVDDEAGNYLLRCLHNPLNSVTVATKALTGHIRSNFPDYKLTCSICFVHTRLEDYRRACELYDLVVMLPIFAYQPEVLAKLPLEKLSFILNDQCHLTCYRKDHYAYISRCGLAGHSSLREQEQNRAHDMCYHAQVPGYQNKIADSADQALYGRMIATIKEQRDVELKANPDAVERFFNISRTTRSALFKQSIRNFKFQGRDLGDAWFRERVVGFLEAILREELS
jgi:hypothetical protein